MKIEREVKKCDRCGKLYEVISDNPDWKILYLDEPYDLCGSCYNKIAPMLRGMKSVIKRGRDFAEEANKMDSCFDGTSASFPELYRVTAGIFQTDQHQYRPKVESE